MTIDGVEWNKETERLAYAVRRIRQELEERREEAAGQRSDVVTMRKYFWDDITVNFADFNETLETLASVRQQAGMLAGHERMQRHAENQIAQLQKLVDAPYFGRVDFHEKGFPDVDEVYIGLSSFIDEESGVHLVYDWRAPIASLFYDYSPGPARFEAPGGTIDGEMTLKRQYVIESGVLQTVFDTSVTIGDEMLRGMLGRNADEKMRSIVATIQSDQNRIIREDVHKYIVVQGAAGSGKTSAALQRIAYLLYKNRDRWDEDRMLLFSPNHLFSDYIANVLPELGENNVRQTTFHDYLENVLGDRARFRSAYEQTEWLVELDDDDAYEAQTRSIRFKASVEFLRMLERYARLLRENGMMFRDLVVKGRTVISADELVRQYYADESAAGLGARLEKLQEWIVERVDAMEAERAEKLFAYLMSQPNYLGTEQELLVEGRRLARKRFAPLRRSVEQLRFVDLIGMYAKLFEDDRLFAAVSEGVELPEGIDELRRRTVEKLRGPAPSDLSSASSLTASSDLSSSPSSPASHDQHGGGFVVDFEDAVPIAFLKQAVEGLHQSLAMRHVVIDEAQDYSPFQLHMLRSLFPKARMTLLGDFHQAVYAHSNRLEERPLKALFGEADTGVFTLTKSYRSTEPIVRFTSSLLPDGANIEPFARTGPMPEVHRVGLADDLVAAVHESAARVKAAGASNVAVICKSAAESERVYNGLLGLAGSDVQLVTSTAQSLASGIIVLPVYLAKGLEFDAVIVCDAGEHRYRREEELPLLYTACTRALHQLHVLYTGTISPFLNRINDSLYEHIGG